MNIDETKPTGASDRAMDEDLPSPEEQPAPASPPAAETPLVAPPPAAAAPAPVETMPVETAVATGPATSQPRRASRVWMIVAIVLIVAVLVESVLLFRGNRPEHDRTDALTVSRTFLTNLTTYDSSTLDSQRSKVLALATGGFHDKFDQAAASLDASLKKSNATSKGSVVSVAIVSINGDRASVLSLVDVTVTNSSLTQPRLDHDVIQLTLVRTSSGWRVDDVIVPGRIS